MPLHYVDVCADGTKVEGVGLTQLYVSAEKWADGTLAIAWKGVDDIAYASINGSLEVLGLCGGEYPVLVTPRGDIFWVNADCRTFWIRGDAAPLPIPIGPTTQGFAYYDETVEQPIWMDTVLQQMRPLSRVYRHGQWSIGLDPDADRVLAIAPWGEVLVVASVYTPVAAKIRQLSDGSAIAAISLPKDDATYFVASADFQPWSAPAQTPAPQPEEPKEPSPEPKPEPKPEPVPDVGTDVPDPGIPNDPPPPKKKPWWVRLLELLIGGRW